MSFESQIVVPQVVSKNAAVLRIDLRDLGWDKGNQWPILLRSYPYALKFDRQRDQNRRLAKMSAASVHLFQRRVKQYQEQ